MTKYKEKLAEPLVDAVNAAVSILRVAGYKLERIEVVAPYGHATALVGLEVDVWDGDVRVIVHPAKAEL